MTGASWRQDSGAAGQWISCPLEAMEQETGKLQDNTSIHRVAPLLTSSRLTNVTYKSETGYVDVYSRDGIEYFSTRLSLSHANHPLTFS